MADASAAEAEDDGSRAALEGVLPIWFQAKMVPREPKFDALYRDELEVVKYRVALVEGIPY